MPNQYAKKGIILSNLFAFGLCCANLALADKDWEAYDHNGRAYSQQQSNYQSGNQSYNRYGNQGQNYQAYQQNNQQQYQQNNYQQQYKIIGTNGTYEINPKIEEINIGLSWTPHSPNQVLDYDVSMFVIDKSLVMSKTKSQLVYYKHRSYPRWLGPKVIKHKGDDISGNQGQGTKDNERIYINLKKINKLYPGLKEMVITISSSDGNPFNLARNTFCRITTTKVGTHQTIDSELVRYNLDHLGDTNGYVVGSLHKNDKGRWVFTALGQGVESVRGQQIVEPKELREHVMGIVH